MIYHVHIDQLVTYPPDPDRPDEPPVSCLYGTINGLEVPIVIPPRIPITKPAIREYLTLHEQYIIASYERILANQPIHNYEIGMDFDWEVP